MIQPSAETLSVQIQDRLAIFAQRQGSAVFGGQAHGVGRLDHLRVGDQHGAVRIVERLEHGDGKFLGVFDDQDEALPGRLADQSVLKGDRRVGLNEGGFGGRRSGRRGAVIVMWQLYDSEWSPESEPNVLVWTSRKY